METWRLALDYIEVLRWPLVVITVVVILAWRFRNEIGEFIVNIRSIGAMGIKATAAPVKQAVRVVTERATTSKEERAAEVEKLKQEYGASIEAWSAAYDKVMEQARIAERALSYEMNYRAIYGSQIRLLEFLRGKGPAGVDVIEVFKFFQQHQTLVQAAAPGATPDFNAYVDFVRSSGLVTQSSGAMYAISDYGKGFLDYLESSNIPKAKPY